MDIKPAHPSEPPKFAMKLLNEQFDEQHQIVSTLNNRTKGASNKGEAALNYVDMFAS